MALTALASGCAGTGGGTLIAAASPAPVAASSTSPVGVTGAAAADTAPTPAAAAQATMGPTSSTATGDPAGGVQPSPTTSDVSATATFEAQTDALDDAHRSTLSIGAVDLTTGRSVSYDPVSTFYTASIVKVDLVEALLLRAQDQGRTLTASEATCARAAITVSDNDAATDIFASLGRAAGLTSYNKRLGLVGTVVSGAWGLTRTSAADQLQLLRNLTTGSVLTQGGRTTLLSLMSQVEADQRWGVPVAGDGAAVVKNGWLSYAGDGGGWIVNSIGVVTSKGHTVLVAVLTRKGASQAEGIAEVQQAAALAVSALTGG